MGRHYGYGKALTEDYMQLRISELRKWGYLSSYKSGNITWNKKGT